MSKVEQTTALFVQQLETNHFFSSLSKETLTAIVTEARPAVVPAGATIFEEGEPPQGLYWLETGAVKAVKYSASGKEQILQFIKEGQTFNELGALTIHPNPATAIALEDVKVWCIPKKAIDQHLAKDNAFAQHIINVLAERLHHTVSLIGDLSLRSVASRIARLILDESEEGTLFRPPWFTQYELAARVGTVTDVVQRTLRKLEAAGLIKVERKQIHIINRKKLAELVA